MRRLLLTNGSYIVLLNLLVKPIWILLIDRGLQNQLGPVAYGSYYTLLSLSLMLSAVLDAGLSQFNTRTIASEGDPSLKNLPSIVGLKAILWIVYMLGTLGIGFFLDYPPQSIYWLLLLGVQQGLHAFNLLLRSILSGQMRFKREGWMGILDKWLMTAAAFPLIWLGWSYGGQQPITAFIWIQLLATLVPTLLMGFMLGKNTRLRPSISWVEQKSLLKQIFPFALLGLLAGFYTRIDLVMIRALHAEPELQAGLYASSYRLLDATNMIPVLLSGILLPQFAHHLSKHTLKTEWIRSASYLMLAIGLCLSWGLMAFRHEIMASLYKHQSDAQTNILFWIGLCCIPISLSYVWGTLLTAAGQLKTLNQLAIAALLVNLGLNLWLIPISGGLGAAQATLITQLVLCVGQGRVCIQQFSPAIVGQRWWIACVTLIIFIATASTANQSTPLALRVGLMALWPIILLTADGWYPRHWPSMLYNGQKTNN